MSWGMGGEAEKIAVHCQAEIALETGAWECARQDLQAQSCKVKKEVIIWKIGKITEEQLRCSVWSSSFRFNSHNLEKKRKIALKENGNKSYYFYRNIYPVGAYSHSFGSPWPSVACCPFSALGQWPKSKPTTHLLPENSFWRHFHPLQQVFQTVDFMGVLTVCISIWDSKCKNTDCSSFKVCFAVMISLSRTDIFGDGQKQQ